MKFHKTLIASAMLFAAVGAQAAPMVVNGSFEANSQAAGTWNIYNNLTGWTGNTNIELRNNVAGTAQDGKNFVELDTTKNMSMSQTITFSSLGDYVLSFWYAARPDNNGRLSDTDSLGWSIGSFNGSVLQDYTASGATAWQNFTRTFTVDTVGTQTLTFAALGTSDSYGGSLDNVSITSAVPETSTYIMMLAGLGLMATIARRRKGNRF